MKIVSKSSMKKIEEALAAAHLVSCCTPGKVPTPAFCALSACIATIAVELDIDLLTAIDKMKEEIK